MVWFSRRFIEKKEDLQPDSESYFNVIELIKNLRIQKELQEGETIYSLISEYNDQLISKSSFMDTFTREVSDWLATNEDPWIGKLVGKIVAFIRKFANEG